MKLASHTIKELQGLLEKKEIQPNDIIDSVAEAKEARDERIGGYLSMDVDHAKQAAANTEASGPLAGIPIAAGILYPFTGMLLSPIIAAAAMSLSSVSVIGNALRLRMIAIK